MALLLFLAVAFNRETADIRAVLDAQVAAWNRGDLESYMGGYWHSPELEFYSGATITRGWQQTLDRYRKRYQSEGREMGTLTFSELRIEPIDSRTAFVTGRWQLAMKKGESPNGLFTLLLRKFDDGWKIVHDHSS
jgi:beta-aspartyl-peptidase (threonine type)